MAFSLPNFGCPWVLAVPPERLIQRAREPILLIESWYDDAQRFSCLAEHRICRDLCTIGRMSRRQR